MINQTCAICEKNNYRILFKANFRPELIDEKIFSARRLPDRIHYQIVQCKNCGLVYSNPILPQEKIEQLYKKSDVDYQSQIGNLQMTYGFYLKQLEKYSVNKGLLLEVGCGNGFFLEEALSQGYRQVYGVEPGKKSVEKAKPKIKKRIIVDIFKPGQFKKNFFDIICCFQTFDHIPQPNQLLEECYRITKKSGLLLFLNHNVESLSARLLKEASPIIDIEHTYLYSKKTITQIFEKHQFKVLEVKSAFNIHYLFYWLHLFPIPRVIKKHLVSILERFKLDKLPLKIYPGNLVIIARK